MSAIDVGASRQMRTPDQLNRAIRLTSPSAWLLLLVLALCVGGVLAWSVLGRVSIYVYGPGVIQLADGVVYDVNANAQGIVSSIEVKPGDRVKAGDEMFKINQLALTAQRDATAKTLKGQKDEYDSYKSRSDADVKNRKDNTAAQITALQSDLKDQQENLKQLKEIHTAQKGLLEKGLSTQPQVESTFADLISVEQAIRDIQDKIGTLQLDQVEFENQVDTNLAAMRIDLLTTEGQLEDLNAQLAFGSTILSPADGLVTDVTTEANSVVNAGALLAVVEAGESSLGVQGYLPIGQGKRVQPGMRAEIAPTSVERDIYGSLRGTVLSVSTLPLTEAGLQNVLGNRALVSQLMAEGAPIQVTVALEADPGTESGFRWTSSAGPPDPAHPRHHRQRARPDAGPAADHPRHPDPADMVCGRVTGPEPARAGPE